MLFSRGAGPLVSVLLPTRNRSQWLVEAVDSLHSLAADKSSFEIVFKVDVDDEKSLETTMNIGRMIPSKIYLSSRGNGYADMHKWFNTMVRMSEGDWILLFNDDARMNTQNWDAVLASANTDGTWHGNHDVCVISAYTIERQGFDGDKEIWARRNYSTEFLFIRRKVIDILGHLSLGPHTDNWLWTVFSAVGSAYHAPLEVRHMQGDQWGNDSVWVEGQEVRKQTANEFHTIEAVEQRLIDAGKLLAYLKGN